MVDIKEMVNFDFPDDIVTEVLSRLPAKSLLRFKSVCKTWYELIKNPSFLYKHGKDTPSITSILVATNSKIYFKDDGFYKPVDFESLILPSRICFGIKGICEGLVCIGFSVEYGVLDYIICNPTTRDFLRVPSPDVSYMEEDLFFSGFCSIANEYKVVRVIYQFFTVEEVAVKAVVYTVSTGSWVEIAVRLGRINKDEPLIWPHWVSLTMPVFQNGVLYWEASNLTDARVVSFNISEGFYDEIDIPRGILNVDEQTARIIEFKEEISLLVYNGYRSFDMWSLNGNRNSWTWKLKIDDIPIVDCPLESVARVVDYKSNGELLVENGHRDELKVLLYDLYSREAKILPCVDVEGAHNLYFYTESLHSVQASNEPA